MRGSRLSNMALKRVTREKRLESWCTPMCHCSHRASKGRARVEHHDEWPCMIMHECDVANMECLGMQAGKSCVN